MKKLFINPDFELIKIGLVADVTTDSQIVEDDVPVEGNTDPPAPGGGEFGDWDDEF